MLVGVYEEDGLGLETKRVYWVDGGHGHRMPIYYEKMVLDRPKVEWDKGMVVWAKRWEERPKCAMEPKMEVQSIVAGGLDNPDEWYRIQIWMDDVNESEKQRAREVSSSANPISIAVVIATIVTTSALMIATRFAESKRFTKIVRVSLRKQPVLELVRSIWIGYFF